MSATITVFDIINRFVYEYIINEALLNNILCEQ